ncbi:MAG: type IV secretion system DNA-binding domain-containing protein [Gammaproteobacteria bacterium]|nr:type IV secretion system DNA-binding domain-containing protein [Gammaproteobacteria bacterium]
MALSKSKALLTQFYDWELRGRGVLVADTPVDLEPPFHPFFEHYVPEPYIDDGKRSTIMGDFINLFKSKPTEPTRYQYEQPEYLVYPFEDDSELVAYSIVFSKHHKPRIESIEQLYVLCSFCTFPLSLEIVATDAEIRTYLICRISDKGHVFSQLKAFFPDASIQIDEAILDGIIDNTKASHLVDYCLKEEFMRPLNMAQSIDHDPYLSLFGVFEQMKQGQRAVLQILFQSTQNAWAKSTVNSVTDGYKGSFFLDAPDMPQLAQEKVSKPLYGVAVRLIAQAHVAQEAQSLLQSLNASLVAVSKSKINQLQPISDETYSVEDRLCDILLRQTHRFGMLLNSRELATLAHFPNPSIASSKLVRDAKKTKAIPISLIGYNYVLGTNVHQGIEQLATLSVEQRTRHIHIIGATGTRKSSMLLHLINQDIQNGDGCAILDPHGDLIENILPYIPKERIKDVVVIDPNDREFPISFNILSAHSEIEKEVLASDLVALFKRFSTSWGDQMNSVFANAIIAFLDNTKVGTLLDLRRFLIEKEFREKMLLTVTDPDIVYYWRKEFPLLKGGSIAPILTRLDTFLRPKLIRNMVSQKNSLNFQELMDSKKIILVKLSEGMIGAENSFLLGAFIVSKIQQSAMARQAVSSAERSPFYLYIDEFQHFITPSMANMLSGVRKYGLGLVLAHQDMQQVSKYDVELANSLLSNAGTRVCFRLGDTDAKRLADGFASFNADDLQNLSAGTAIARVGRSEDDFSLITSSLRPSSESGNTNEIIEYSRSQYGAKIETSTEEPLHTPESPARTTFIPAPTPLVQDEEKLKSLSTAKQQTNHRYKQVLIKKMAEAHGYKASLEVLTPDGKGKVDVLLERDGKTIAVEVSDTTEASWELHNIEKCINANYTQVYACVSDPHTRHALQKLIDTLQPKPTTVTIGTTEELLVSLQTSVQPEHTETRMKGYRVNVQHRSLTSDEASVKRAIIESIVKGGRK